MLLFDLLKINFPNISEADCKLHLATWNGYKNPVDVFLEGKFEDWQSWQSKKNFERTHIISLLQLPGNDRWLFAGGFISINSTYKKKEKLYRYETSELDEFKNISGRLIIQFSRTSRQSYLNAETWSDNLLVREILPEKMAVEDFSGYNKVRLSRKRLEIIFSQSIDSWRGALSGVSGVYVITDTKTGKLYIGSATGGEGIWQRWSGYAANGHGDNKDLVAVLSEEGAEYCNNFQYSILEIADTHASKEDVLARESYWKNVLCSKEHGYNNN